jgi:hypothetical protein
MIKLANKDSEIIALIKVFYKKSELKSYQNRRLRRKYTKKLAQKLKR